MNVKTYKHETVKIAMAFAGIQSVMQDYFKTQLDACTSIDSSIATIAFIDENIITWLGSTGL